LKKELLSNTNDSSESPEPVNPEYFNAEVDANPATLTREEVIDLVQKYNAKVKKVRLTGATSILLMFGSLIGAGGGFLLGTSLTETAISNVSNSGIISITNTDNVNWTLAAALKATPSVVSIISRSGNGDAAGSGIVYDTEGHIVSSAHLFQHSQYFLNEVEVEIRFSNGEVESAKILNVDLTNDVAVLKLDNLPSTTQLVPAEWRDSETVQVGDQVIAIGSPLELYNSVTQGIISSTERVIQLTRLTDSAGYNELGFLGGNANIDNGITVKVLQTDAPINPGNSGGGLVDSEGKFIGLNAAISGGESIRGLGFSIPGNNVTRIADSIIKSGGSTNGLLGAIVGNQFFTENTFSSFSVGALVAEVSENGPAQTAGIQGDYVITKVNETIITSASDLVGFLRTVNSGTEVSVSGYYLSEPDVSVEYKVVLGSAPNGF
jgi:putative serine protease PepD